MNLIPVLSKIPNLAKELVRVLPNVTFHEVKDPESDVYFRNSEILICDFDLFGPYMYDLPEAKWISGTWAGIDKLISFVKKDKIVPYQITRFTGDAFGRIMSEYVVANIVNYERDFYHLRDYQQKGVWSHEGKVADYRTISDMTIGILGLGNIGNKIGRTLSELGAKVLAFGRRSKLPSDDEHNFVTDYYTKESLPSLLRKSDYVISVLPSTVETNCLLDGSILQNCSEKKAVFINIGRSNIIPENTIIKAINNQWIAAAILDVFDIEPLPESSPLWKMEQVFITPHVAGLSRARDIAEHFKQEFNSYTKHLPLRNIIDLSKGY